ncbi:MAG: CRISPR-associated protein Cas5 [Saccharolobus sp.]
MAIVYSFDVTSEFALFADPTINTNKVSYNLPSKTTIVGLLGAILGIKWSDSKVYTDEFLRLYKEIKIGIDIEQIPQKTIYYTNHVSFKKVKHKPFKVELLVKPKYKIYLYSETDVAREIVKAIPNKGNEYDIPEKPSYFTPFLGNAYCLARLNNLETIKCVSDTSGGFIPASIIPVKYKNVLPLGTSNNELKALVEYNYLLSKDKPPILEPILYYAIFNKPFYLELLDVKNSMIEDVTIFRKEDSEEAIMLF